MGTRRFSTLRRGQASWADKQQDRVEFGHLEDKEGGIDK